MKNKLSDGIPLARDYRKVIESETFKEMEQFSDRFLLANKLTLKDYMKKWVGDPLHQWSRQWEYPFVYSRAQQLVQFEPRLKILDAGSGVTFFPYLLNARFDDVSIYCCDYDETLSSIFKQINHGEDKAVEFLSTDLRELPYENESFDMVYCISVLEHTDDYEEIIEKFYKILKPGGTLIVTFDISLDGTRDINVDKASSLLTSLVKPFEMNSSFSLNLHSHISNPEIFTTLTANDISPDLLPWNAPSFLHRIKSFLTTGRFGAWPPPLTVCCLCLTERPT